MHTRWSLCVSIAKGLQRERASVVQAAKRDNRGADSPNQIMPFGSINLQTEQIMEIIQKNNSKDGFFIAEENSKRMGYISYEWMNESVFAIMHTVVEPAFQGKGIAKALLDAAVAYARENDLRIHAVCSYVVRQFEKKEYDDVNSRK